METQTQNQNQKQSQETLPQQQQQQQNQKNKANMKKSSSKNSDSSAHYNDSPHSPLRFHSPLRSELGDPPETPPYHSPEASPEKPPPDYSKAVVAVDKYTQFSPQQSTPEKPNLTNNSSNNAAAQTEKSPSPLVVFNRAMREEPPMSVTKVGPSGGVGGGGGGVVGRGVEDGRRSAHMSMLRRSKRDIMVGKAALGFRFCEIVLCLISFSVMAADKTQGWSGDSFERYTEYRYCLSVNVIAFVYSGFQAYDLAYNMISGKHVIRHHLRRHFTFFMDQVLAYLLISASSSAASRVDDWQSNWGKDEFTIMASASVGMAFLAFVAFAFSSLISGYYLFAHDST